MMDARGEIGAEPAARAVNQHMIEGKAEAAPRCREDAAVRMSERSRKEGIVGASVHVESAKVALDTEHQGVELPIVAGIEPPVTPLVLPVPKGFDWMFAHAPPTSAPM